MGRPKSRNRRARRVVVLVTASEGAAWDQMAARERLTVSELVRAAMTQFSVQTRPKRPPRLIDAD